MSKNHDHAIPFKILIRSYIALLILTFVTVVVTFVDFSDFNFGNADFSIFNIILAMIIATIKAVIVITFFMGMYKDKHMNLAILFANITFLFVFFFITVTDFHYRQVGGSVEEGLIPFTSPVDAANQTAEDDDWSTEEAESDW